MSLDYDKLLKIEERVILELNNNEIFEGVYIDGGKDRIVLKNVFQHNNLNRLEGPFEFYRNEIKNIHTLKLPKQKINQTEADPQINTNNSNRSRKILGVCEDDYFRLKDMCRSYIYIENADHRYFEAIKVLNDAETIGVVFLGTEKSRFATCIKLLVICTWKQVYIFDMANLNNHKFYPEIKDIFESEYICKVIHKSSGLVDILFRQYKIYLQNVFDTQIVDLMLQKKETGSCPSHEKSISECLIHYLNFPASLLEEATTVPNSKWNERPLEDKMKLYASQLAAYLIVLKEHFHKLLLNDIYGTINKIQDYVYNLDDLGYYKYMKSTSVSQDIQKMIPILGSPNENQNCDE